MSLEESQDGRAIHFPANPDRFAFDQEVSQIFPEMARRSIPLFYETHRLHAYLCKAWMQRDTVDIIDIGASRGAFLHEMQKLYSLDKREGVTVTALDYSMSMVEHLRRDFPWAYVGYADVTSSQFMRDMRQYDIINCTYVVQFVPRCKQVAVLSKLAEMLKPGGVLFLGQKTDAEGTALGRMLHDQYIRFRLEEGYSLEEIQAKTAALKNSMWPMQDSELTHYLRSFGLKFHETSRWTVFNNYACTKGL